MAVQAAGDEEVVALGSDDKKTKQVDPVAYRALVAQATPKQPAMIVADHRIETRRARVMFPITKPPWLHDEATRSRALLVAMIVVAIGLMIAILRVK